MLLSPLLEQFCSSIETSCIFLCLGYMGRFSTRIYHIIVASAILTGDIRDLPLHLLLEETQERLTRPCVRIGRCLDFGFSSHVRFCFLGRHAAACSSTNVTETQTQLATVVVLCE